MWESLSSVLEEYAIEVRNLYQDILISEGKIATGDLLNSVEYIIEQGYQQIQVSLKLEDYWKYCEFGREPGKFPPPDKIKEWLRVKPILPRQVNGKLPTPDQLAFLIGRKIATEGIEATNALAHTLNEVNLKFNKKIEDAITKDVNKMVDVIFSEYLTGDE